MLGLKFLQPLLKFIGDFIPILGGLLAELFNFLPACFQIGTQLFDVALLLLERCVVRGDLFLEILPGMTAQADRLEFVRETGLGSGEAFVMTCEERVDALTLGVEN